jgi:DNA-binding SARP family transcriptional activator/tetratricopeptide (TPR) repeat protein
MDEVIRFRLLGPLQVWTGGAWTSIGADQQRTVVALLLVDAGQVVPTDRIVDQLWGDRPPARAVNTVQGYVVRLRRLLNDPPRLVTRASGYQLLVEDEDLDSLVFERLAESGRRALEAGRPGTAADELCEAIGLWRGPALADVSRTPAVAAAAARLDERLLDARETRIEAELELSRHAAVLAETAQLVAERPLRERLRALHMLALYRSGRRAEALEVYQQGRRILVTELGLEPGPDLDNMHRAILADEPALAAPPRPAPAPITPAQLPADVAGFSGRSWYLKQLDALLPGPGDPQPGPVAVSALAGTAGVGKTALAVHWAHQVREKFPDGQLYVNLRGFDPGGRVMEPAEAIRGFLDAFGVPPQRIPPSVDAQAGLYRSLLAGKRVLVVLDNARDAEHARPLLPGTPTGLAVMTSRSQLTPLVATAGAHPLSLDVLPVQEARELLARRLGPSRLAAEPQAVQQIIACCARLPLALSIVAARAQQSGFPLSALAAELADAARRLDALDAGDAATQVRAVFSWSYHSLTPAAARLFRLLGLHPGPDVSAAAAASLAGHPPVQTRPLLAELARANILTEHTAGRYTFHDLLRVYATDLTHTHDSPDQRRAATIRLLDHYTHTAHAAARLLNPALDPIPLALTPPGTGTTSEHLTGHQQAMAWLTAEHPVLLATLQLAADTGHHTHAWQLAWALDTFLLRRGHWHDRAAAWQTALAAADHLRDPAAQARTHRGLARAHTMLGRYRDAHTHLKHALNLQAQAGDRVGQAHTHHHLAYLWDRQGRPDQAIHHGRQALALFRAAGHHAGQAQALNQVGWSHALQGDHAQALTHCQQALTLFQQLGDREGQAATWDSLGYAHDHLGHHTQAADCYQHALTLFRDLGDRYEEATTLTNLGDAQHAAGNPHAARTTWRHALDILTDLDHPDADAVRAKLRELTRRAVGGG